MKQRMVFLIGLALAFTAFAAAAEKPNFSGSYILDMNRTRLQSNWGIEGGEMTLVHQGDRFSLSRTFRIKGQAEPSTASYEGTIGGPETVRQENGQTTRIRLYWDGDVLVGDMTIQAPQGNATNVVRYALSEEGKTLTADEKFRGPRLKYDNLWVAVKQ